MPKYLVLLNTENVVDKLSKSVRELRFIKTDDYCRSVQ